MFKLLTFCEVDVYSVTLLSYDLYSLFYIFWVSWAFCFLYLILPTTVFWKHHLYHFVVVVLGFSMGYRKKILEESTFFSFLWLNSSLDHRSHNSIVSSKKVFYFFFLHWHIGDLVVCYLTSWHGVVIFLKCIPVVDFFLWLFI